MNLELLNTGTEILLGNTLNSHLPFLGQALFPLGLRIARQATVPDGPAIREALAESLDRADIVLVTGGLGPTSDDLTRDIAAELLGLELAESPEVMRAIEERFAKRGKTPPERSRRQARVPAGATVLPNPHGTAPGLSLRADWPRGTRPGTRHLFLLPGPPRELRPMVADHLLPALAALLPAGSRPAMRSWIAAGLGESEVEARVGPALEALPGLELGYCARPGEVEIRCIGPAETLARAGEILAEGLGARLVSSGGESLDRVVERLLRERGQTLAVAESCTGGALGDAITDLPGASSVFLEGFVTYANAAKTARLGVTEALLAARGAVSAEAASAMASGAREKAGADWALAITGIAGPDGGSEEKPVGTVFVAVARPDGSAEAERHLFATDRKTFKRLALQTALDLLRRQLLGA